MKGYLNVSATPRTRDALDELAREGHVPLRVVVQDAIDLLYWITREPHHPVGFLDILHQRYGGFREQS